MTLTAPSPTAPGATRPFGVHLTDRAGEVLTTEVLAAAHRRLQRKAVVVVVWFAASYAAVLAAPGVAFGAVACLSLAFAMAGVGFNIQHDANHNALFATGGSRRLSTANRVAGWSINMIGGDAQRWQAGHVRRHHSSPNVVGRDDDISLEPFARLAPSQTHRSWHRFQHLYLWPLYTVTAVAIFVTDVTATIGESRHGDRLGRRPGPGVYARMLASKATFVLVMVGVPLLVHTPASVTLGALGVAAVAGLLLGVVFQLAHTVQGASFRDDSDDGTRGWHEWQVRATVDFCHGTGPLARAVTWFMGGLNYQVEHHLFPTVPHTAYPLLAPVVSEVCAGYGLAHQVQPSLRAALAGHHRHLRALSRP